MRVLAAVLFALAAVHASVHADEHNPEKWPLLTEADAAKLVLHPEGRHWFIPASAPPTPLNIERKEECSCVTQYYAEFVYRLTACSLPDYFDTLTEQVRKATLGYTEGVAYLRTFLAVRDDAALPSELYCVTDTGPWPGNLEEVSYCPGIPLRNKFTLTPFTAQIPPLEWSGSFGNHPVEIMFTNVPAYLDGHCIPCGNAHCGTP